MPNHLVNSSSPYLLQHADNPVDWFPWGPEALEKARLTDRPIFLSIGYAACHWCHVMAHESFEDPAIAGFMNAHFVSIKVDREQRPDLDSIYMQAVVAITGQGGWPMSVFLTPDGVPFYGGTYFPPVRRYSMPAFLELLQAIAHAWETDRPGLLDNGKQILNAIQAQSGAPLTAPHLAPQLESASLRSGLDRAAASLAESYDWTHGGWGRAPRFPQPMTIEFLLRRAARGDLQAFDMATHALQAMSRGGMYDLVGGGFARYSTDDLWRIPHFEKMLYDNAQLASAYLHAWLVCKDTRADGPVGAHGGAPGQNIPQPRAPIPGPEHFRRVCEQTLDFVLRELAHPLGGFYSSLDADSAGDDGEHAEGRFYLWTPQEIRQALGDGPDADFLIAACGVTDEGNFDGRNALQRALDDDELARRFNMEAGGVPGKLESLYARLLESRSRRPRPATDDKILVSWNALMLAAFAEAGRYLHRPDYLAAAQRNARFLLDNLLVDGKLARSWREPTPGPHPQPLSIEKPPMARGEPQPIPIGKETMEWEESRPHSLPLSIEKPPMERGVTRGGGDAFLEDYAALILGLLCLYQSDGDAEWYRAALRLADEMTAHFADPAGGFFDTRDDAEALLFRPKDLQDNATPSGSALAACALLTLAAYGDRLESRSTAEAMLASMLELTVRHPSAFAQWLCAADFALGQVNEVAMIGDPAALPALLEALWNRYRPRQVTALSTDPPAPGAPALLQDRPLLDGLPTVYVCQGLVCQQPVHSVDEMLAQLDGG